MEDFYNQIKSFKSFEVVFESKDHQSQKILCSILSIENNCIVLETDDRRHNNFIATPNDELTIYMYTASGIYSGNVTLLSYKKRLTTTEYVISYPENTKHSQRREFFRADMVIDFRMEIETKDFPGTYMVVQAKTRDICGKGMSYISDKPFPDPTSICINLYFTEKTVETHARLVYSKQILVGNHPKYLQAFTFTDISQKSIDFIVKKCFLYQLECRKRLQV